MTTDCGDIFLGSGASITFVPENDIYFPSTKDPSGAFDGSSLSTIKATTAFSGVFSLVNDLYIGCIIERYNSGNSFQDCARITANTADTITFRPALSPASGDYFVITQYGAPVPAPTDTAKRLLADEWLGLVESITFPTTEVEMKPVNLALGGSRNYTYQYKGIETASGGNINLVSNHAAWLYYFFGRCTGVSATTSAEAISDAFVAPSSGAIYIDDGSVTETGPIFYRSVATNLCPPIAPHLDAIGSMDKLTLPTASSGSIQDAITYTFEEQNGELLPSFSLEQVFSKLPSTNTYRTTTDTYEDTNFVKIARGNRVNNMTITANENEEIKMTMELNTRTVHDLETDEVYDARRGVTDETAFFNYDSEATFREPFFFSSGYFKAFGVSFLKINSITLTMSNSLTERRFIGVGNKSIQEGIPAQRIYELQFTGHVVDDRLYQELVNQDENNSTTDGQMVELNFSKANGEEFTLKFKDYMVSANDFPLPDDKGPVVVDTTITPRNLHSCSVTTHWVLQG